MTSFTSRSASQTSPGLGFIEDVEHFLAVIDATARLELVAEQRLVAGVVEHRHELEPAALLRSGDRPAGERAREAEVLTLVARGASNDAVAAAVPSVDALSTTVALQRG